MKPLAVAAVLVPALGALVLLAPGAREARAEATGRFAYFGQIQ